jgi:hypothetical protein
MSAPTGSAASSWTDEASPEMPPHDPAPTARPRSIYLRDLALRREALAIRRQIVYGLVMGWFLFLVAGFLYFCVPSRFEWLDRLWSALMALGGLHLAAAVIVPQALYWPERIWTRIARWQGWLIMTALLSVIYFALIWPAGCLSRRRTRGFVSWEMHPTAVQSAWQTIELVEADPGATTTDYRSLPLLLAGVIGFFFRRGDYLVVLIVILLVVLGLVLYFVQSSALAPFIYTLF